MAHRIAGLSEVDATEKALTELGRPQEVSVGMARLYTMPTMMGSGIALVAVFLTVIALWPKGIAQTLQGTFYWPSPECLEAVAQNELEAERSTCFSTADKFWISQKELRSVLEPQGVVFKRVLGPAAELLSIAVPGTTPVFVPLGSSETSSETVFLDGRSFTRSSEYLSLWNLVERFAINPDARLRITGWDTPTVKLNDVSFELRNEARSIKGSEFYGSYLSAVFYEGLAPSLWEEYDSINIVQPENFLYSRPSKAPRGGLAPQQASLRVGGVAGDVYGVVTYLESQNEVANQPLEDADFKDATFRLQLGRVTEQGDIRAQFPEGDIAFLESFGYGKSLKPGDSVLVRLAGSDRQSGGWYEVVSPKEVTLEPTP